MLFRSDSGHWYNHKGESVWQVPGSGGRLVSPDIRHARKLQLAPGVTTILRMADRPQLTRWREMEVCRIAALRAPKNLDDDLSGWIESVIAQSREVAAEAALAGSEIHAKVESDLLLTPNDPWIAAVRSSLAATRVKPEAWKREQGCVSKLGFATKSDLHADGWVIDIKTKDGDLSELETYDEHAMQLAATSHALGMLQSRSWSTSEQLPTKYGILYVRRDAPEARLVEVEANDIRRGWECFLSLLVFWQKKNKYAPSWATPIKINYE